MKTITNGRVAVWTIIVVVVLLAFAFLWLVRSVLFLIFLGILLTAGIEPLVKWLRRGPFNRGTGVLAIYTLIFAVIGLLLYLIIPPFLGESQRLVSTFTNRESIKGLIANIDNEFFRNIATQLFEAISDFVRDYKFDPASLSIGLTVLEGLFAGLTVFVIGYYWSTERPLFKRFVLSFVDEPERSNVRAIWGGVEDKLGAWMRGQLIVMLITGVVSGIGYTLIGLNFAFPLAVFAALTELIPLIGPYIGGAPAALIGFTQSFWLGVIVIVGVGVFQVLEGNILVPRVMKSAVGISPLTVIVSVLMGSALLGITGALLAVPVGAAIQVIITQIFPKNTGETESTDQSDDHSEEKHSGLEQPVVSAASRQ